MLLLSLFGVYFILLGIYWVFSARDAAKASEQATAPFVIQGILAVLMGAWALHSALTSSVS